MTRAASVYYGVYYIAPGSGQAAPALVNRPPRFYWWASKGVWRYPVLRYKRPKNTIIVIFFRVGEQAPSLDYQSVIESGNSENAR